MKEKKGVRDKDSGVALGFSPLNLGSEESLRMVVSETVPSKLMGEI